MATDQDSPHAPSGDTARIDHRPSNITRSLLFVAGVGMLLAPVAWLFEGDSSTGQQNSTVCENFVRDHPTLDPTRIACPPKER